MEGKVPAERTESVAALRKRPPADSSLELLAAMIDDAAILLVPSTDRGGGMSLYALDTLGRRGEDKLPFVLSAAAFHGLYRRGYVAPLDKKRVEERLAVIGASLGRKPPFPMDGGTYLSWQDQPYSATAAGREWCEGQRGRLDAIRAAREAAKGRGILIAMVNARPGRGNGAGVGGIWRVVQETPTRYQVEEAADGDGKTLPGTSASRGPGGTLWVDKSDVHAVGVTAARWKSMRKATLEFEEAMGRSETQMESEIAPIRRRHAERRVQLLAELEDGLAGTQAVEAAASAVRKR